MGAARKKKSRARADGLPTYEVDVDDDRAVAAVAEALVGALLSAAAGRTARTKKAKKKSSKSRPTARASKRITTRTS